MSPRKAPEVQPVIEIDGQPSSESIRREFAESDEPVLLAFSRGKDSIAAWLALLDAGVRPENIFPYHMYLVPDLQFVAESLAYFEKWFSTRITNIPHASLYRWLDGALWQAPQNLPILEAAAFPTPEYEQLVDQVRQEFELPAGTWVADGVRAADSPTRRLSMASHGPRNHTSHKVSVIWDWRVSHVRERIARAEVELPVEYEWFKRSFDGLDYRFLKPMSVHAPEDYARVLQWFPLAGIELFRHDVVIPALAAEDEQGETP